MRTNALTMRSAMREVIGEVFGTFLLVFIGLSANASGLIGGSVNGLWQIASVWGFALAISIYVFGSLSGAHFNPTVTISLAAFRRSVFNWRAVWYYLLAQFAGVFLAAQMTYIVWDPFLRRYETNHNITRGTPGSFVTASIFGEYFPNPGLNLDSEPITPQRAMFVEAIGTFLLVFVVFAFSDKRNKMLYESAGFQSLAPFFIGFTLSILIVALAPMTQAGFNPTRDFAARLVAYIVGWRSEAIPGPHNGFWIYIVGPLIGGPLGGLAYEFLCGAQHSGSWSALSPDAHPLLLNEEQAPA